MSMLLEESNTDTIAAADRLRHTMAGVRLSISWFGVRKSLTSDQKAQAADAFGAEGEFLSAGKKLLDTRHPAFKLVTGVRTRAVNYWKGVSLPFPEAGIRLIPQDEIDRFDQKMESLKTELEEAVWRLDEHFAELKDAARQRLGSLFNSADYPESLQGLFKIEHDFPAVEPPDYLRRLNPELYERECRRVADRFDQAVQLAEEAFTSELSKLVSHLTERLAGAEDGKPKVFRDSAVENLQSFFERFKSLNIGSNEQLDELVTQCQQVVGGVVPQDLRNQQNLRQHVAKKLSGVQSVLDGLLVDRPRRNILRRAR